MKKKTSPRSRVACKAAAAWSVREKAESTKDTATKKARFLKAYEQQSCNISAACRAAKIKSRKTFYRWLESDPVFAEQVSDLDEADLDFSEGALKKQIGNGNIAAIIFHLKTKGRRRGYIEQIDGNIRHSQALSLTDLQGSLNAYEGAGA